MISLQEFINNWLAWGLLLLPLFSAAVNFIWLRKENVMAQIVSVSIAGLIFLIALGIFYDRIAVPPGALIKWITIPGVEGLHGFHVEIGWLDNALSRAMLLVVTGVGFLVHVFSIGYMDHDKDRARFFGLLSLFMFSMIGIVIANNLIMMYIFWELVGLSSYLLVGFWWYKESASAAAKKAFLCNRVGDFGFLLGILMYWGTTGTLTLDFESEAGQAALAALGALPGWEVTTMGLLLFCGCVGKSAMFPLHVWLPDAMEGPTPVSALIHAATMVAAGVYMLCRIFAILDLDASWALTVVAWVGAGVCLGAAFVGCQQDDIKRILAYSTLSQLGYMVMAVGIGAPGAAMFHLSTHACFKAGLFLCSGAIIHQCHEEQDTWRMGGLWKRMPITVGAFLMCALALSGCPYTAGYFSKDLIIELAGGSDVWGAQALYWIGFGAAILTAFYMFRLMTIAFVGKPRTEPAKHAKEYGFVMIFPVVTLALFALGAGWPVWGWEDYYGIATGGLAQFSSHFEPAWLSKVVGWSFFAIGTGAAILLYLGKNEEPYRRGFMKVLNRKFYFDELYDNLVIPAQQLVARVIAWVDDLLIGGLLVRGSAALSEFSGQMLRLFQTGNLQAYAFLFALGLIILFYFVLFRLPLAG
ncbi:MAG: NADH-quinone oxidoreductase subunit L [Verrucomicrobiota bacterium]